MTGSVARTAVLALALAITACSGRGGSPLGPQYEYEEDLTLRMDGSATLAVNASVASLVVLRGLDLPTDLKSRADQLKEQVRAIYSSDQARVTRVSTWTRQGRRFVGVNLRVDNIRALPASAPFSWAAYDLREQGEEVIFRQRMSKPVSKRSLQEVGLTGNEIVAFRLHLPARIRFQNSRWLDRDESRPAARGNIITWEQRLEDRWKGQPIAYAEDRTSDVMEARMDKESILYRTLWLFALAFGAALLVLAGLIWFTMRRGEAPIEAGGGPGSSSPPR